VGRLRALLQLTGSHSIYLVVYSDNGPPSNNPAPRTARFYISSGHSEYPMYQSAALAAFQLSNLLCWKWSPWLSPVKVWVLKYESSLNNCQTDVVAKRTAVREVL
jgi:hypothetical protein